MGNVAAPARVLQFYYHYMARVEVGFNEFINTCLLRAEPNISSLPNYWVTWIVPQVSSPRRERFPIRCLGLHVKPAAEPDEYGTEDLIVSTSTGRVGPSPGDEDGMFAEFVQFINPGNVRASPDFPFYLVVWYTDETARYYNRMLLDVATPVARTQTMEIDPVSVARETLPSVDVRPAGPCQYFMVFTDLVSNLHSLVVRFWYDGDKTTLMACRGVTADYDATRGDTYEPAIPSIEHDLQELIGETGRCFVTTVFVPYTPYVLVNLLLWPNTYERDDEPPQAIDPSFPSGPLRNLPTLPTCPVCYEDMEYSKESEHAACTLPCGHQLCHACVLRIRPPRKCGMCSRPFRTPEVQYTAQVLRAGSGRNVYFGGRKQRPCR